MTRNYFRLEQRAESTVLYLGRDGSKTLTLRPGDVIELCLDRDANGGRGQWLAVRYEMGHKRNGEVNHLFERRIPVALGSAVMVIYPPIQGNPDLPPDGALFRWPK